MPRARQVRSESGDEGGAAWTGERATAGDLVSFLVNSGMVFSSTSASVGQRL